MDVAPIRPLAPARMTPRSRIVSAAVAAGALAVMLVAAWLKPSSAGTGSHHQLGMQPCRFLEQTGLPCGTCGMTTSFAHFAHGNIAASAYVQPFGAVAALITAMGFWAATYCAATGRPAYRLMHRMPAGWIAGLILTVWLLAWGWKMWLVLAGRDGWNA